MQQEATQLLENFDAMGVSYCLKNNNLHFKPKLSNEMLEKVKRLKPELIKLLPPVIIQSSVICENRQSDTTYTQGEAADVQKPENNVEHLPACSTLTTGTADTSEHVTYDETVKAGEYLINLLPSGHNDRVAIRNLIDQANESEDRLFSLKVAILKTYKNLIQK